MPQDILIVPKSGEPQILFRGSGTNDTAVYLNVLSSYQSSTGSGTALVFEGTQGQLLGITDNLSSGTIFSVSDITGLPAIEYNASGRLNLGEFANNINLYSNSGVNVVSKASGVVPFSVTLAAGQTTDAFQINSFGQTGGNLFKATANGSSTFGGQFINSLGTITASTPATFTQTWNNAGTTFTGILGNFTDTNSASASLLLDLQVGGSSKFKVEKGGQIRAPALLFGAAGNNDFGIINDGFNVYLSTNYQDVVFRYVTTHILRVALNAIGMPSPTELFWTDRQSGYYGFKDLVLARDAAGTLAQRNGASAQVFNLYNTYTDASNYERAKFAWSSNLFTIGPEKAGTGSYRRLSLESPGGTVRIATAVGNSYGTWPGIELYADGNVHGDSTPELVWRGTTYPNAFYKFAAYRGAGYGLNFTAADTGGTVRTVFVADSDSRLYVGNYNYPADSYSQLEIKAIASYQALYTRNSATGSASTGSVQIVADWNTTGTPTAVKVNVIDAASNANSLYLDVQASGTTKFNVGKNTVKTYNALEVMPSGSDVVTPIRFYEASGNGSNYVGLQSPVSVSTNITWTLPSGDGLSGQVLCTDGSGVLYWRTI